MKRNNGVTKEQAIALYNSAWWVGKEPRDIVRFQLFETMLCMPFDLFHEATEAALGRPVYTHEFGIAVEQLRAEFLGESKPPSADEILSTLNAFIEEHRK